MVPIPAEAVVLVSIGVNVLAAVIGYYVGVGHVDRLLDIDEGEAAPEYPPGVGSRESERIGPLSVADIDDIEEWESLSRRKREKRRSRAQTADRSEDRTEAQAHDDDHGDAQDPGQGQSEETDEEGEDRS